MIWVHRKLPQSTVKQVLPSNDDHTLATVLWVPLSCDWAEGTSPNLAHSASDGAVQGRVSHRDAALSESCCATGPRRRAALSLASSHGSYLPMESWNRFLPPIPLNPSSLSSTSSLFMLTPQCQTIPHVFAFFFSSSLSPCDSCCQFAFSSSPSFHTFPPFVLLPS